MKSQRMFLGFSILLFAMLSCSPVDSFKECKTKKPSHRFIVKRVTPYTDLKELGGHLNMKGDVLGFKVELKEPYVCDDGKKIYEVYVDVYGVGCGPLFFCAIHTDKNYEIQAKTLGSYDGVKFQISDIRKVSEIGYK